MTLQRKKRSAAELQRLESSIRYDKSLKMNRCTVATMIELGWLRSLPHNFDPEAWDAKVLNNV